MKVAVLASGGLGAQILQTDFCRGHDLVALFTDKNSLAVKEFAEKANIPLFTGNPRNGKARSFIQNIQVDVLISINYLFIIDDDLIHWPGEMAFNLHGSLLPKYRGRTPHVWAIINNESLTGITAHLIDSDCDMGDVIEQIEIAIGPDTTGGQLLLKFEEEYPELIKKVLGNMASGTLSLTKQDDTKATYFGKRTPGDGQINWAWHKERIKNWVRAQANPYPGAFSFLADQKITIDKVSYSDRGFDQSDKDGLILETEPKPIVKSPNGALVLEEVREQVKWQKQAILQ